MKKLIALLIPAFVTIASYSQSADERVGDMMNNSQWFELRDYFKTNNDSVSPFLEDFAQAMLAHFFNNPSEAISRSLSLMKNHLKELDIDNLIAVSQMTALNLQKLGKNADAADVLTNILASTRQYLDSTAVAQLDSQIARHSALGKYEPYKVSKIDSIITIPLRIEMISVVEDQPSLAMAFIPDCKINNTICDVQFDTGAGMNVISTKRAAEMDMKFLDVNMTAQGLREVAGIPMAIVDSLVMDGLTIYDVPFLVLDITAGHELLDSVLKKSEIIIGLEVINALKHINLDFQNPSITVSNHSFVPADEQENMMLTNGNNIIVRGNVGKQSMLIHPDCGDASYGIFFGSSWNYMKSFVSENQQPKNSLLGGTGGYDEVPIYKINNVPLTIASTTISIPQIDLAENYDSDDDCDVRIGLKTFLLYDTVAFDMERMIIYPTK
ncbi:MAG: retropepsin-like domain-containing protein [Muribaculaceae bacterium]|nr:retropepsin-like domain-containing protein [Muribaculaceae bacterium]